MYEQGGLLLLRGGWETCGPEPPPDTLSLAWLTPSQPTDSAANKQLLCVLGGSCLRIKVTVTQHIANLRLSAVQLDLQGTSSHTAEIIGSVSREFPSWAEVQTLAGVKERKPVGP